ncbi:MAG TPA: class I SAM-dependent methyltransferase, partial [Nitrospiraceae bacterium]|nr:class I SAM-dependent methyltransferase [Nitrospiraceae bacterium]
MRQWYEKLFENYAEGYDGESFTQGTVQEVDFIEKEIGRNRSLRILDVGCGTGRHSVELAKRGYAVTGIDLSEALLNKARQKAAAAGVTASFIRNDARDLSFESDFDVALMICEGAFPLMETDEMNFAILAGIRKALKSPGKLILTTLSAIYPLKHSVDALINAGSTEERSSGGNFDLMTFRM